MVTLTLKKLFFNSKIFIIILMLKTGLFGALFGQQTFVNYTTSNSPLVDNRVNCVAVDNNNVKWIGTEWGLMSYDESNWVDYSSNVNYNPIRCVEFDNQGKMWVGSLGGLFRFDGINWTLFDTSSSNLDNQINCITFDSLNHPCIGTLNGLFKYNGRFFDLVLDSSALEPYFVNVTTIQFQDDSLIIGTKNGGVGYMYNDTISWYSTFTGGLPDNSTYDIEILENDSRLFASPQGGLIMHTTSNFWFNWNIVNTPSFPTNSLTCIEKLDTNLYVSGTIGAGFFTFYFQTGTPVVTAYNSFNSPLPDNFILSVVNDLNDVVWFGTETNGLVKWDNTTNIISSLNENVHNSVGLYDLLGRKTEVEKNKILFNIKEDFSVEKVLIIE